MKFHEIHGQNILLDEIKQKASRISSFYDAIVFSDQPIRINSYIPLQVCSDSSKWSGSLFIGLTTKNPNIFSEISLPKHIVGLLNEEDIWIKPIPVDWSDSHITIHVTYDGIMEISSSDELNFPQIFFTNLPTNCPLWLIFDIYGSSSSLQFATYKSPISSEMLLLGPDMTSAYKCGADGVVPYNRTRIMILGACNSGKSSLKRALINNNSEESCDKGLDCSVMCSSKNGQWVSLKVPQTQNIVDDENTTKNYSEKDIYQNLAKNIVIEINASNKQQSDDQTPKTTKDLVKNILRFSTRKIKKTYLKEMKNISDSKNDIPEEEMTAIIENILKGQILTEEETNINKNDDSKENSRKIIFNIWDFTGYTLYFLLHQVFFTSYAIYILVIDISEELEAILEMDSNDSVVTELHKGDLTNLNIIHYWLSVVHTMVGRYPTPNEKLSDSDDRDDSLSITLQPQVIIVGTHRNSIHLEPITRDQIISEVFDKIYSSLEGKPYRDHLSRNYIAIDFKEMSFDEPKLLQELKEKIEEIALRERLVGFDIPAPWMEFEQIIEKLKQRGIYFADINQLHEVTRSRIDAFHSYDTFNAVLHFYHNQGKICCLDHIGGFTLFETQSVYDCGIIILDPNWFLNCIYKLCSLANNISSDDNAQFGILSENLINKVWSNVAEQKFILLGCLEKLDIIYELQPYIPIEDAPDVTAMPKLYFFPWITRSSPDNEPILNPSESFPDASFQLVIDFNTLPVGLFSRLLVRLSRWSWNQGWGRRPEMYNCEGRIAVDFDHDLVLKISRKFNRIFIMIVKIFDELQHDQIENFLIGPTSNVCVKVQHLIESELENLRNLFYRRANFKLVVPCPCDVACDLHKIDGCNDEECLHFITLEECLTKKVVECKYTRQVRTMFVQRYFPHTPYNYGNDNNSETLQLQHQHESGWDHIFQIEPLWMREAAKLLSTNHSNRDWMVLAKRLGYSDRDNSKFMDDSAPCLALLRDWYETNGRTRYCVDVLLSCLRMISREDVASLIEYDLEPEGSAPPVFISYQRDSQEQVLELRRKLELAGFPCWMDTRSIGGGDSLYGKIYDGISRSKVIISCLTPRYAASSMCTREITLADVLHKPILPIILEYTPWPPPGAMAVIMASICYVDLCGVGSHSGIGRLQDSESRFREILDRVSRYIAGYDDSSIVAPRYMQLPDIFSPINDTTQPTIAYPIAVEVRNATPFEEVTDPISQAVAPIEPIPSTSNATEQPFTEEVSSGDNLSMTSNPRRRFNRITNCSICSIL